MPLLDQHIAGIIVLLLWAMVVVAKRTATGSLMKDRPQGGCLLWLIHIFNFSFLLVAVPLAAILLMTRSAQALATTHLGTGMWVGGLLLYAAGCMLMAWALFTLGENYQVGGNAPRSTDKLVTRGPYRFVRHPMYAAALCISLGLSGITHSLAYFCVFLVYVLLILLLIPREEDALRRAYGEQYPVYRKTVKRLAPPFY